MSASAAQIALFEAPSLVIVSYFIGRAPMSLEFWRGGTTLMLIATIAGTLLTNGRSAWFVGMMMLMVYAIFALTLFQLAPLL